MTLNQLLEASGMEERDFCYALSCMSWRDRGTRLKHSSFAKMLSGEWIPNDGILDDAHQVCADAELAHAVVAANPELREICHIHFKYALGGK